ncbi:MAG: endonuclease III [Candidatus Woesearchaeota archaeon]
MSKAVVDKHETNKRERTKYFLEIFQKAEKKYSKNKKRLAGEGWKEDWMTLIATILSAQTRDETTIPVAEALFKKYPKIHLLAKAKLHDVEKTIKRINFYKNKSKNIIGAAKWLMANGYTDGSVPDTIEELIKIPGVGRKTANLIITEVHKKDGICVDTHVHRISNVFGFVNTKNPKETEFALMDIVPRKYWSKINRIFVLWGKEVKGRDKEKFLKKLNSP